jgi:predicted DCC family thiol-disulfide oxidoreductase YuxK
MTSAPAQESSPASAGRHLVLYDGVCGLCNRLLQFLFTHDRQAIFSFASLQSATGRATVARWGGNPDELSSFYVVADFRTSHARVFTRSDAALFVAGRLPWPWKAMRAGAIVPKLVRDLAYNAIARSRYRIFGRYEQCMIPAPEMRRRFVDQEEP